MSKPPTKIAAAKKPLAKKKSPPRQPKPRKNRRGTPKGKGVAAGRGGGGRIGNPKFRATDELKRIVETHAACGTPHWLIAVEIKISVMTLYKYFRFELDTGLLRLNARIGSLIAKQALEGDRASQSLWMKTHGWNDKLLLTTPPGEPIQLAAAPRNSDLKKLSDEEAEAYLRIQAKLEGIEE